MNIAENEQELLEVMWIATEEQGKPGLAVDGSLPDGASDLIQRGLVQSQNGTLTLTHGGRIQAADAIRRHRLAERLLTDVLKTEEARIDQDACRLEHALFEGVDDSICTLLGHPPFCPHGKPIPAGRCCEQARESVARLISPLRDLAPGQGGSIAYIQLNHSSHVQKLMGMGVMPGAPITLRQRFPSFVFEAGYSQFAVDEEMASDIYVRLTPK